ncbi:MAG: phosphoglycerate mutase family protein [Chloroflexota bacterium]|nr:phosphoglycerate mutase family protein [Chloroflexota bacterium]
MHRVLLVRHAEPNIDIDQPAGEWSLTPRGVASTQRLAVELKAAYPALIVASPERKALETAQILGEELNLPIEQDARFSEQGAEAGQFLTDYAEFRALVRYHFDHPDEVVLRQETSHAAGERFAEALLTRLEPLGSPGPPVIVSHGRIMASWLASLTGSGAWDIWTALRLPDLLDVDIDGKTFRSLDVSPA